MKSKLKFLTGVSLKRKIKTKWFVIANALIALVIIAGLNIDTIITAFGGEFNEKTTIYVIDHTNESYDLLKDQIRTSTTSFTVEDNSSEEAVSDQSKFTIKRYQKSEKEAKKLIADEKKTVVLVLDHSDQDVLTAKLISKDYLSTQNFQIINAAVNGTKSTLAFQKSNISSEELARINTPIKLEREYLEKDKNEAGENNEMIMGFVFPIIILPFFMLTLFLVQMIGAEVNDEKTTRGMEIIISNVSPKTHFFSKVIAGNLFVIIQSILLFIYGGIGLLLRTMIAGDGINGGITDSVGTMVGNLLEGGMGEKLIYIIPLTLLLMILTFISYSLLAGILASMT
ncbi:MAG: ABC transporter permease, partial [Bacilli bacterium]|nr:ABC transporter permease [Bacilli bacterium]